MVEPLGFYMVKAEKVHFPVAIVLYDIEVQSASVPLT